MTHRNDRYGILTSIMAAPARSLWKTIALTIGTEKNLAQKRNARKFGEQGWRLTIHTAMYVRACRRGWMGCHPHPPPFPSCCLSGSLPLLLFSSQAPFCIAPCSLAIRSCLRSLVMYAARSLFFFSLFFPFLICVCACVCVPPPPYTFVHCTAGRWARYTF